MKLVVCVVVCETTVAITLHLRELQPDEAPCYTGRLRDDATTLCGAVVGWDTRIPIGCERCQRCIDIAIDRYNTYRRPDNKTPALVAAYHQVLADRNMYKGMSEERHQACVDHRRNLRLALARIEQLERMSETFPTRDIVRILADATEHLLHDHDCDCHGHERRGVALKAAQELLAALDPPENP